MNRGKAVPRLENRGSGTWCRGSWTPWLMGGMVMLLGSPVGCSKTAPKITICAAISVETALKRSLETWNPSLPKPKITPVFGASGTLARQIEWGVDAQLFLSANEQEVIQLEQKQLVHRVCSVASNRLLLIHANRPELRGLTWENLANFPAVQHIAIGQPDSVPVGRYALQSLKKLGIAHSLQSKLVYGSHARHVLELVVRNEAEAGIVYATDVRLASNPQALTVVGDVPERAKPDVRYWLVEVGPSRPETHALARYLCSEDVKKVFESNGFSRPLADHINGLRKRLWW
jgi:molybdate transport system substrate-binding protein